MQLADGRAGLASTAAGRLRMLATLLRITTSRDSPDRIVTSLSFKWITSPMIPPEVTT